MQQLNVEELGLQHIKSISKGMEPKWHQPANPSIATGTDPMFHHPSPPTWIRSPHRGARRVADKVGCWAVWDATFLPPLELDAAKVVGAPMESRVCWLQTSNAASPEPKKKFQIKKKI